VFLSICDHFEPLWNSADAVTGLARVKNWHDKYPVVASSYSDFLGNHPKYTFFYPAEEYSFEYLQLITDICSQGVAEVEIHLHHKDDTADNLSKTLLDFKKILAEKHGLLSQDRMTKEVVYGFIHGNWALNNSHPEGKFCGVNNETEILQKTGCYADFTMPSAPDCTQTAKINSIYYAVNASDQPKSHNSGTDVRKNGVGKDGLLMVQGPLLLNWKERKSGIFPRIENGCISFDQRITAARIQLWLQAHVHVKDAPEYIFIKLYTHGCQENNSEYLLNEGLPFLYEHLGRYYNDGKKYRLYYTSARETVNVIKALEAGQPEVSIGEMKNNNIIFRLNQI